MFESKSSYRGVSHHRGGFGKLSFASGGLIYYPDDEATGGVVRKFKLRWGSVARKKLDPGSLSLTVYHVANNTQDNFHTFFMRDIQQYHAVDHDFSLRLASYKEREQRRPQGDEPPVVFDSAIGTTTIDEVAAPAPPTQVAALLRYRSEPTNLVASSSRDEETATPAQVAAVLRHRSEPPGNLVAGEYSSPAVAAELDSAPHHSSVSAIRSIVESNTNNNNWIIHRTNNKERDYHPSELPTYQQLPPINKQLYPSIHKVGSNGTLISSQEFHNDNDGGDFQLEVRQIRDAPRRTSLLRRVLQGVGRQEGVDMQQQHRHEDTGATAAAAVRGGSKRSRRKSSVMTMFRVATLVDELAEDFTEEPPLSPDAYSLLYTARSFGHSAFFACFVVTFQMGMLLLAALDLMGVYSLTRNFDYGNDMTKRWGFPPGATIYVTCSQLLGFLLTVVVMASEGDFVVGAERIIRRYNKRITEEFPRATWTRWLFTGLLQAFTGCLLLFNVFILSMKSTSVIDLALNLTALHFIQEFDDQAFHIAKDTGLLGNQIKKDCEAIENYKIVTTARERAKIIRWKRILIAFMSVCLLVPGVILVSFQYTGRLLCKHLYIQFGDAYHPELAHYSGLFHSQGFGLLQKHDQRNYYLDETETYQIGYCYSERAWTISRATSSTGSTCDYIFKSPDTETFDILDVANDDWVAKTVGFGDVDVDWLKIRCNDCSDKTCNPKFGVCSDEKDRCVCKDGMFGTNCQFKETCHYYALDQRTRDGLISVPGTRPLLSREYMSASIIYPNLTFYERPIYVPGNRSHQNSSWPYENDIDSFIVFTGRRWVIYSLPEESLSRLVEENGKPSNWTSFQFFNYFLNNSQDGRPALAMTRLSLELINLQPIFFSSPVNYGEASDGIDLSTVTWMFGKEEDQHVTIFPVKQNATWMFPKETDHKRLKNYTKFATESDESTKLTIPIIPAVPDDSRPLTAKFLCSECHKHANNTCRCLNRGTYNERSGCQCPPLYDGKVCERIKTCVEAGHHCSNAGQCNNATGVCKCDEGRYGSHCQLQAHSSRQ